MLLLRWGPQACNECRSIVGLNAAFVCAGGFEYRPRGIRAVDPGARHRERRPGGAEEVVRAGSMTIGDAVGYDDERFGRVEGKDGIAGVVGKRDAQHRCGRHELPDASVVREREGDIVTGRCVHDGSQNRMHYCNEGDCIRCLIVNRLQKLVRLIECRGRGRIVDEGRDNLVSDG